LNPIQAFYQAELQPDQGGELFTKRRKSASGKGYQLYWTQKVVATSIANQSVGKTALSRRRVDGDGLPSGRACTNPQNPSSKEIPITKLQNAWKAA
jgi:hypothetical protein